MQHEKNDFVEVSKFSYIDLKNKFVWIIKIIT